MAQHDWHSCPPSVHAQVQRVCEQTQTLLDQTLVGIYLHGSLALGCFNVELSDFDLLIVTRQRIPVEIKRQLMGSFLQISQAPCPLELSVLVFSEMHPFQHPLPFDLHYSEFWRQRVQEDLTTGVWRQWNATTHCDPDLAAHLTVARHRGLTLVGQPAAEVLPLVPSQDYLSSLLSDYQDARPVRQQKPVYFILNACRIHAYLSQQRICSKDEGGRYGLEVLPAFFHPFLQRALDLYRGHQSDDSFDEGTLTAFATWMDRAIL
jgi:hypothetical protein